DLHDEEAVAKVVQHPSSPRLLCPSCQAEYRKGDLFCRQCGGALAPGAPPKVICTACGTAVLLPARFCNACGTALPRPEVPEEAPRDASPGPRDGGEPPSPSAPASETGLEVEPENSPGRPSAEKALALDPRPVSVPRPDMPRSAAAPARAPALVPLGARMRVARPALVEPLPEGDTRERPLPPAPPASFARRPGAGALDLRALGAGPRR